MITVIIPVKNGESTLGSCLTAIKKQRLSDSVEMLVIDSGSTDNSISIAYSYGARVIQITPQSFNHGMTRNIGAQLANGSLLYYTVQDAELSDISNLAHMSAHFQDIEVQAVFGIQGYPKELNKNPALWFKRFTKPILEIRHYKENSFSKLSENEQFEVSNWDNVNAMYRKSALVAIPFRNLDYCEDWLWANDALKKGMKILRDPSLLTYHYHHLTFGYVFKSQFIINYHFFKHFNHQPKIHFTFFPFIRKVYTLLNRREVKWLDKSYWIFHNMFAHLSNFFSILLFRGSLFFGGSRLLENIYSIICKKVPQGGLKND